MRPIAVDPTNTDTPPVCSVGCPYRQKFNDFDLQRNALRIETAHMIDQYRCCWNIKEGAIGGRPLDYAPCIFQTEYIKQVRDDVELPGLWENADLTGGETDF